MLESWGWGTPFVVRYCQLQVFATSGQTSHLLCVHLLLVRFSTKYGVACMCDTVTANRTHSHCICSSIATGSVMAVSSFTLGPLIFREGGFCINFFTVRNIPCPTHDKRMILLRITWLVLRQLINKN